MSALVGVRRRETHVVQGPETLLHKLEKAGQSVGLLIAPGGNWVVIVFRWLRIGTASVSFTTSSQRENLGRRKHLHRRYNDRLLHLRGDHRREL